MKMQLRTIERLDKKAKRIKPVDYFRKCPKCASPDLIHLHPDVLCSSCDWDSLAWDVSQGAMDDLVQAAKEMFIPNPILKANQSKTNAWITLASKSNDQKTKDKKGA